jgi:PAS domain S-box-containing protein
MPRQTETLEREKQEKIQDALKKSEERFRQVVESAPNAMVMVNQSGVIEMVNAQAERVFGYERGEMLGQPVEMLVPERFRRNHPGLRGAFFANPVSRPMGAGRDLYGLKKDGSEFPVEIGLNPIETEAGAMVLSAIVDISGRKQLEERLRQVVEEEALRKTQAQLQAIVNEAPLGVYLVDGDFRIREMNPTALSAFGNIPDLIGRDFDEVIHVLWPKALADEIVERFRRTLDTGEPYIVPEHIGQCGDRGAREYYEWQISRVPLPEGRYGVVCYFRDISAQVFAREAIAALHDTLERKVEERTRALEAEIRERQKAEATSQQARKLEAVGQLTGGVAHDFNNVLTAVLGNLELARRRASDPAVERFLQNAQHAAERGAKLADHLLSFARKQPLRREPCDLNRLIASFKDLLARTIGPTVDVRLALADDLWTVMADATQFELALLNLAVNARDAMPEGGTLFIATTNVAAGSPDLSSDLAPGDYACVSVRDTGTGMSEDVAAKVFEPFYTTKEVGKGTGLGLSQVYGFSKQLGGTATLSTEVGAGTSVRLLLPRAPEAAAVASPAQVVLAEPLSNVQPSGARLLVIDDEPDVRDVTVEALRTLGFDVVAAESARRGLELLGNGAPIDLAVVDLSMPEMNGVEFIRRAQISRPDLPCLLITGYFDVSKLGDALSGGTPILRKPYRMTELAATIDHLLAQAERQNGQNADPPSAFSID